MLLDYIKSCEKNMMLSTVITLIVGFILLIEPNGLITILTFVVGIIFMVIGGIQLIDYLRKPQEEKITSISLIVGIVLFSIGIFLMLNTKALATFIISLLGAILSIKSLFKLQFALNIRKMSEKWMYNLIAGLVGMLFGIILIANPFKSLEWFLRVVGALLIVGSILELIETSMVLKTLDDVKELKFEEKPKKEKGKKKDKNNEEEKTEEKK